MSPEEGRDDELERRTRRLRFRIAFFLTSLVALSVIVTLPFSVKSVVDDVLGPVTGRVTKISRDRPDAAHRNHTKLHMAMVAIDETQLLATIRVCGHHVCAGCDWSDRVLFVSVTQDDLDADGMPPSVGVTLPANSAEISEVIQLPVRGHPIHYPFDSYRLIVGVVLQRIRGDAPPQTFSARRRARTPLPVRAGAAASAVHGRTDHARSREHPRRRRPFRVRGSLRTPLRAPALPAGPRRVARPSRRRRRGVLRLPPAPPRSRAELRSPRHRGLGNPLHLDAPESVLPHGRRPRAFDGHHLRPRRHHGARAPLYPRRGRHDAPPSSAALGGASFS